MAIPDGVGRAPVSALNPNPRNARTHSKAQIEQIAASIREFGFNNPVLVDEDLGIIAGHGRVEAAKLLGWTEVPVLELRHLNDAQKRAYILADNKLAEKAGWDSDLLALELGELAGMDLGFDLTLTGFEMGEIDFLLEGASGADQEEPPPEPTPGPTVTQPGDIWQIGDNRLICGDATDASVFDQLMAGRKAQLIFTDPPYNVPIDGHVSGLGKVQHREFAMATGEMSEDEFQTFLTTVFGYLASFSADGAIHFVCMDWRHMRETLAAGHVIYDELKNLCVWTKTNGGMGSLYRSQHELVFVFKSGKAAHINNVSLGRHGRNRSNVWAYAGVNSFRAGRDEELAMHPTVKPLELVSDAILDCSDRGQIVLDAFAGSGTTLLAAAKTGRIGYGIELDPAYCDVILKRFAAEGFDAVRQQTGETFSHLVSEITEASDVEAA
jgi:DNA modification methylase